MTTFHSHKDIEKKLRQAAGSMPEPIKPLLLSPVMEERRRSEKKNAVFVFRAKLSRMPAWRVAVIALFVFAVGSTTIFAASPGLRNAIARFFSSGITEDIPIDVLESEEADSVTEETGMLSGDGALQTAGSLTLAQDITLDAHFTASYVSSPDNLILEETPSGIPLFQTQTEDGQKMYYSVDDGRLEEIVLETHTLTAAVEPGVLPGVMSYGGNFENYRNLALPPVDFTVSWRQYGAEILIDDTEAGSRFDIGSTCGVELGNDYDGQFFYRAFPGNEDIIEVVFCLDAQQTNYQYPFLLNLKTGEVSDPLAAIDLSDWACITELSIQSDLTAATAMAGSSHEDLRKITIDLNTGAVMAEAAPAKELPVDDCVVWFAVGEDMLFYVTGTEESGNGYLYNTKTGESTVLFTDTTDYSMWGGVCPASRYWKSIGYGYLAYYADDAVSLINLQDGGTVTVLEGIPMSRDVDFFMNYEGTVLSISTFGEDPDSFYTARLCLLDLGTMEAWYFDRNLPEGVKEQTYYWNGEYGYVVEAANMETGTNYIYLYQYTP